MNFKSDHLRKIKKQNFDKLIESQGNEKFAEIDLYVDENQTINSTYFKSNPTRRG